MISNFYEHKPQSGTIKHLVILLHGVGSNGRDLISLAPYMAQNLPDTMFISPDAPFPCDMVPEGYPDSYQWFSLQNRDPDVMLRGVQDVFPSVQEFVENQTDRFGLKADNVALLGFSQGTMTSLHVAPRLKEKIAGVVGFSGALLADPQENVAALHKMPICLIHGEADDVVPVAARKHAQEVLESQGFTISGHTTPFLTHSIDEAGIQEAVSFLRKVFAMQHL